MALPWPQPTAGMPSDASSNAGSANGAVGDGEGRNEILQQPRIAVDDHCTLRDRGRRFQGAGQQIAKPGSGGDHEIGVRMLTGTDLNGTAADDGVCGGSPDPDGEYEPPTLRGSALRRHPQGGDQGGFGDDLALPRFAHPRCSPARQRVQRGLQLSATVGQRVDDRAIRTAARPADDHPIVLQLLQPGGEQVGRNAGEPRGKVGVAPRADQQVAQDQQSPSLAEHLGGTRQAAELPVLAISHEASVTLDLIYCSVLSYLK